MKDICSKTKYLFENEREVSGTVSSQEVEVKRSTCLSTLSQLLYLRGEEVSPGWVKWVEKSVRSEL